METFLSFFLFSHILFLSFPFPTYFLLSFVFSLSLPPLLSSPLPLPSPSLPSLSPFLSSLSLTLFLSFLSLISISSPSCLQERKGKKGGGGGRNTQQGLRSAGCHPRWPQQPPGLCWIIFSCFPGLISKEVDQNLCSYGMPALQAEA